jgi:hypothetical protein
MGKAKVKDTGFVFQTTGAEIESLDLDSLGKNLAALSYDPHDVTQKILEFGKILTGIPLYRYQEIAAYRIIYSIVALEGATLTMLFSRQSGKTEVLAFVACSLTTILPALAKYIPELDQFKDGIKIGLFAPQSDQVQTTYLRAMNRISTKNASTIMADPDIKTELASDVRFQLTNGSFMMGQVASKMSRIESKTYDLILCEEAQDLDSFIVQKSIEPMGTATNGTVVKSGTTGTQKNDFWEEIQNNRRKSRKVKDKRLVYHFEFDFRSVIQYKREQYALDGKRFHLNYEQVIKKEIDKGRQHSETFKLSYALIWALESGMFMTDKEFEKILNRKKGFPREIDEDWRIVAGLDIAKENASTVLTILRVHPQIDEEVDLPPRKELIGWFEMRGLDYETQHYRLVDALNNYGVQLLYVDYTGVGKAVVDRLVYAVGEYIDIVPYTFSRPSKSDMWQALKADIDSERLEIPAHKNVRETDEFINFEEQAKNLQKWYEGSFIVAEKARGFNDDYMDSLGLAVMAGNAASPQEIEDDDYNPLMEGMKSANNMIRQNSW